jgi:para-nitrobenzyl esterase
MGNHPPQSDAINRRSLLTRGAALVGGAAGLALAAGTTSAEEKAKTETLPAAKPATALAPPNLHPPVVQVKGGKLRGFKDGKIFTFLGVPYAEAERFEMPKPVAAWEGIKSAQAWGPVCPIPPATTVGPDDVVFPHRYWVENEHCQVLNVWTQSTSAKTKKPVMVWMHGGGFTNGSSMESYAYDGKTLCEFGDVVAVSVNHRLNVIGTLDLSAYGPEYASSRNTGMADLVAALEWVHENIEAFGGDPGNVTIFGQSGGGGKVTRLMHIPAAKGLFHKVICQSGGAVNYRDTDPAKIIQNQQTVAAETLKNLGLDGSQMDKLKKVPYRDLLAAGNAANQAVAKQLGGPPMGWNPIADDHYVLRELCDWAESIPYIAGNVMSEFSSNLAKGELTKNEWSPKEIDEHLTAAFGDKKDAILAEFKKVQPHKKTQDALFLDNRFRGGTKIMLARKLEKSKAPVYTYIFTYEYQVNGGITAFHCSEIAFAFHALSEPHIRIATGGAPAALALQDKVSQAWVNFARTGNPSQPGLAWKPYTLAGRETMVFDTVSEVRSVNDDQLLSLLPQERRG